MSNKIRNIFNQRFGRLLVVSMSEEKTKQGRRLWECKCDCGATVIKNSSILLAGQCVSCGCFQKENMSIRTSSITIDEALQSRIAIDNATKCWNWTVTKDKDGYGIFHWRNKSFRAHRVSLSFYKVMEIPNDLVVCHSCDNPSCINPEHLFVGTVKDNAQDALKKGRAFVGDKNGRSKLTNEQIIEIRLHKGTHKEIAMLYGVHRSTISRIIIGSSWL